MKVLVTGGNGYVGRELTRQLYEGHEVGVMDNLRYGRFRFAPDEIDRFRFFKTDIRDASAVAGALKEFRPDRIIHLAAIHFIPECERLADEAVGINTLGTVNLLKHSPEGTRFVLASTAAVYAADSEPHRESSSALGPMDVYGLSKLHAEQYVSYYARERHLDGRIVRLFNVVGPGETNPHVLPAIFAQVLKGARTLRLGNCHPRRDYIHVKDGADGFATVALNGPAREGADIVNLGTGEAHSVYDVVEQLAAVVGEPLHIEHDPARMRASDRPFLAAAIERIGQAYGWRPRLTLTDALRDLWNNPDIPAELLERS